MARFWVAALGTLATGVLATVVGLSSTPTTAKVRTATSYLTGRAGSAPCLSCHTTFSYVLASRYLAKDSQHEKVDRHIWEAVSDRVNRWNDIQPYFTDKKSSAGQLSDARGSEAVLNATTLVFRDKASGELSPDTRKALDIVWSTQLKDGPNTGAWPWFRLGNEPWEADDSQYWGAGLVVLAVAESPATYRNLTAVRSRVTADEAYLRSHLNRQSLINQASVLWIDGKSPFLNSTDRQAIVKQIVALQQPDGGWSIGSFAPQGCKRRDGTPFETASDGLATSLAMLALEKQGGSYRNLIESGRKWLLAHEQADGSWKATSLNAMRDPTSDVGKFMTDAATAYAVLALGESSAR